MFRQEIIYIDLLINIEIIDCHLLLWSTCWVSAMRWYFFCIISWDLSRWVFSSSRFLHQFLQRACLPAVLRLRSLCFIKNLIAYIHVAFLIDNVPMIIVIELHKVALIYHKLFWLINNFALAADSIITSDTWFPNLGYIISQIELALIRPLKVLIPLLAFSCRGMGLEIFSYFIIWIKTNDINNRSSVCWSLVFTSYWWRNRKTLVLVT